MTESGGNTVVVAAVADLFFFTKIEAAAKRAGVVLVAASDARQLGNQLAAVVPALVIIDLNCAACEPLESIRRIRSDPRFQNTRILGFLAHVQKELAREAKEAGCGTVMSRSEFSAELVKILATDFTEQAP